MNTPDEEKDNSKEPEVDYKKRVIFFNSIEEKNEYDYKEMASYTPSESLSQVTRIRLMKFPYLNTTLNPFGDKIYFE